MTIAATRPVGLYVAAVVTVIGLAWVSFFLVQELTAGAPESRWIGLAVLALAALATRYAYLVCWSIWGREVISASDGCLSVDRELFGRRLSHDSYRLSGIERLAVAPVSYLSLSFGYPFWYWQAGSWGFGVGPVRFDYEGTPVRIAEGLRGVDDVAGQLVVLMQKWIAEDAHTQVPST